MSLCRIAANFRDRRTARREIRRWSPADRADVLRRVEDALREGGRRG